MYVSEAVAEVYAAFTHARIFARIVEVACVADAEEVAVQIETYACLPRHLEAVPSSVAKETGTLRPCVLTGHCYGAYRSSGERSDGIVLLLPRINLVKDVDRNTERDDTGLYLTGLP